MHDHVGRAMNDDAEDGATSGTRANFVITEEAGHFNLTVTSSIENDPGFETRIFAKSQFSFADAGARLRIFKDLVEEVEVRDEAVTAEALGELLKSGNLFAYNLFGQDELDNLRQYLKVLFTGNDAEHNPVLIEIAAAQDVGWFPLELMPILTELPELPETKQQSLEVVRAFPGFAAIVRRRPLDQPLARGSELAMGARLPLRLFRYGSLETELFDRADGPFEVRGPWPLEAYKPRLKGVKAFSGLVFDAAPVGEDGAEQVHHFACHCQTGTAQAGNWEIQLAPPSASSDLLLRFDELLLERSRRKSAEGISRPLVFMNACGSAMVDPLSIVSLPRLFLENRNCTFIGTETRIPPKVAAFISQRFYEHLLPGPESDMGVPAGRALHAAKWELLTRHGNPSGVLYTLYGDPDAVVVRRGSNKE